MGEGGTIRTVLNVAGHLASRGWEVEILGTYRRRRQPFFGDFPPGVKVTALDNRRSTPRGPAGALVRRYPALDALVVLTDDDLRSYTDVLGGALDIVRIPNAVPDLGGEPADLGLPTVLAAGRLRRQKGFDLLVPAWAQVAPEFPDWRLRVFGSGPEREKLAALIAEHGLDGSIVLEDAAGSRMELWPSFLAATPHRPPPAPLTCAG